MWSRLIGSAIVVVVLAAGAMSSTAAADPPQPLLSGPLMEDNMPRAKAGKALPIPHAVPRLPWVQQAQPIPLGTGFPFRLGDGGVQRFETPEELDRHLQWQDFMLAFELLLQRLRS